MGRKKIKVVGILIETPPKTAKDYLPFDFTIAGGSPANPLFYSSPRLRELIAKFPYLKGKSIGHISYWRAGRNAFYVETQPFLRIWHEFPQFIGKGIATELEDKTSVEMRKRFGEITLKPRHDTVMPPRKEQLKARGIKVREGGYEVPISRMISGIRMVKRKKRKQYRTRKI